MMVYVVWALIKNMPGVSSVMNTSISLYFILPFLSIHNKVEY